MEYYIILIAMIGSWITAIIVVWMQWRNTQKIANTLLEITVVKKLDKAKEVHDFVKKDLETTRKDTIKKEKEDEKILADIVKQAKKDDKIEEDDDWMPGVG